jgi:hypothetical protein
MLKQKKLNLMKGGDIDVGKQKRSRKRIGKRPAEGSLTKNGKTVPLRMWLHVAIPH